MPIKWSAVKVNEAMDDVERQINLAESFLAEARTRAQAAKHISNLPQYMEQRLNRLIDQLGRLEYIKSAITSIRDDIPDGAIKEERDNAKHGTTQSLV